MTNFNLALLKSQRRIVFLSLFMLKPMWLSHQIRKFFSVYYPVFRESKSKKSFIRIAQDLFYLSIRYKCIPFHYFHYGLYDSDADRRIMDRYIPETVFYYRILPYINENYVLLDDKIVTDEILVNYRCPRPKLLMISRGGKWYDELRNRIPDFGTFCRAFDEAKDSGAVIKPAVLSSGGEGILFLAWNDVNGWSSNSATYSLEDLFVSPPEDLIVQEKVENGGSLERLGSNVLQCVRVLTSTLNGEPRCLYATLKISDSASGVDNGHAGGAYLPVDLETGKVGLVAFDEKGVRPTRLGNRDEGLGGFIITEMDEIISVAKKASIAFPSLPIIGWDISVSRSGALIIEGNSSPGLALIQKPHGGAPDLIKELETWGVKL